MTQLRYTLCSHRKAVLGWFPMLLVAPLWIVTSHAQERIDPEDLAERIVSAFKSIADEDTRNDAFCAAVGGQRETRHSYQYPDGEGYVVADCETDTQVIEGGLDKRSSLDSVQQALFFSYLTGKDPVVVVYDTDGQVGPYEHRIQVACELAGVRYIRHP